MLVSACLFQMIRGHCLILMTYVFHSIIGVLRKDGSGSRLELPHLSPQ